MQTASSKKIINDPVYGFINITGDLIFRIIEHPYFQRLRNIRQLGLTNIVYPGATHTRFQHVLGAMHLMEMAIEVLRSKGHQINAEEEEAAKLAILLHDVGHGPFSHTLEHSFVQNISHEDITLLFMQLLNKEFQNKLDLCIQIFQNKYPKKFLHSLVSSQLDMDRLDYLRRDSFFTGVVEGVVGVDRIIKMLNIAADDLVIEAKGIYSIENFLISRRLMYWQVYLHKTVVAAEQILIKIIERARFLLQNGEILFGTPSLLFFLKHSVENIETFTNLVFEQFTALEHFSALDDNDIFSAIKIWINHKDKVLSELCKALIYRNLLHIELRNYPFDTEKVELLREKTMNTKGLSKEESNYFVFTDSVSNKAYISSHDCQINILFSNNKTVDIAEASDISNVSVLSKTVTKNFLCYPKEFSSKF